MACFVFFRVPFFMFSSFLLPRNQHDSEASFVSHHASVSFCRICQRDGFDHRADSLQGTEGKRVFCIDRRSGHCSRNRTRAKKKRHRIDLDWFISPDSRDNELAAWSKSSEKRDMDLLFAAVARISRAPPRA